MGLQRDYLRLGHVGRIRRQARGSRLLSGRQPCVDPFRENSGRPVLDNDDLIAPFADKQLFLSPHGDHLSGQLPI